MRIQFLSNLYPPYELGGMEQLCQEVVDRLGTRGHACQVLTSCYAVHGQLPPEEGIARTLHLQADVNYYRPLDYFLRRPWQERANRRALCDTLDAFQPDVVFIWGLWNLSPQIAYWAEQWRPGRVAYAVAGYWPMELDAHAAYWQRPTRHPLARVLIAPAQWVALHRLAMEQKTHPLALEQVACVSEYVRRKLVGAGALPHGRRVIYNGIDPQPFLHAAAQRTAHSDQLRLVFAGGLVVDKGVHTAIEALGLLHQQGRASGLQLTIVGAGHPDYAARLRRRVDELGLAHAITLRGRMPRSEIAGLLAENDIFLFTSVYEEPIARTVMEAMAAGLAVIGTGVGGQREMLEDGVNALVFSPDDAADLARCIEQLRRDQNLRLQLANAGRQTVLERFTLERMVDEMEAWLTEIVDRVRSSEAM